MSGLAVLSSPGFSPPWATTAAGPMHVPAIPSRICVSGALAIEGTVGSIALATWSSAFLAVEQTSSGVRSGPFQRTGAAVMELRRLSGLNWDQLARIFGTSRRSLHFWASGKALSAVNEERLRRVIAVVRRIDSGSARENRSRLLTLHDDGTTPLEMLAQGKFELVIALLQQAADRPPLPAMKPLAAAARAGRRPHAPGEVAAALQDTVHSQVGRVVATTPIHDKRAK